MLRRPIRLAMLAVAAMLLTPALAGATTLTPAGDVLDFGSQASSLVMQGGFAITRCTVDLGAARIPAAPGNSNPSGPLGVTLSSNPSFTGCTSTGGWTVNVTTTGGWSATFGWGSPIAAAVNAPARGVTVTFSSGGSMLCQATNGAAGSATGSWQNGSTSPFADSTASLAGSLPVTWTGAPGVDVATCRTTFGSSISLNAASVPVRDATNPGAVILVGP